jgi:hypothetical protein
VDCDIPYKVSQGNIDRVFVCSYNTNREVPVCLQCRIF